MYILRTTQLIFLCHFLLQNHPQKPLPAYKNYIIFHVEEVENIHIVLDYTLHAIPHQMLKLFSQVMLNFASVQLYKSSKGEESRCYPCSSAGLPQCSPGFGPSLPTCGAFSCFIFSS